MASVEKRGKSWRLVAFLGYENGIQVKRFKTIPTDGITKHEAQKLANKFEAEAIKAKGTNDQNLTFSTFAEYWKKNVEKDYSITTRDRNTALLTRILPSIGHIRLRKLTAQHIMAMLRQLEKDNKRLDGKAGPLSARTIQMHYKLVSAMLGKAVKWKMLDENVCARVDTPKSKSKKIVIYENEEDLVQFLQMLFLKAALKYQAFFLLALTSGLRRSEILGLRWSDINFKKSFLRVNQAAVRAVGKGVVYKEPKTESSEAPVPISRITLGILQQLQDEQKMMKIRATEKRTWKKSSEIIFVTATGTPMFPSTFGHWLKKFTDNNELKPISVHAFRHMAATYALDGGFDLKHVSEFVRHSQVSTTGDIYAHPLSSRMKQLVDSLDKLVRKAIFPGDSAGNPDEKNTSMH